MAAFTDGSICHVCHTHDAQPDTLTLHPHDPAYRTCPACEAEYREHNMRHIRSMLAQRGATT